MLNLFFLEEKRRASRMEESPPGLLRLVNHVYTISPKNHLHVFSSYGFFQGLLYNQSEVQTVETLRMIIPPHLYIQPLLCDCSIPNCLAVFTRTISCGAPCFYSLWTCIEFRIIRSGFNQHAHAFAITSSLRAHRAITEIYLLLSYHFFYMVLQTIIEISFLI